MQNRKPTRVHTRKIDRGVARERMHKKGLVRVNKKEYKGSYFKKNWREYSIN